MKGSEKQIKWAEDIKRQIVAFDMSNATPVTKKIMAWAETIDDASWWIDMKGTKDMGDFVVTLMAGTFINNKKHILTREGKLIKKWSEIISDGKGGYKEEYEEMVLDFTQ